MIFHKESVPFKKLRKDTLAIKYILNGKFCVPNVALLHFASFSSMFCLKQLRCLSFFALIQCCIIFLIGLFEDYQNICNEHKILVIHFPTKHDPKYVYNYYFHTVKNL